MISFFNYAIDCVRLRGLSAFMYGDVVVMENYGRITERTLRKMLEMRGVTLLF